MIRFCFGSIAIPIAQAERLREAPIGRATIRPTNNHISNFYLRYRYSRANISITVTPGGVECLWGKSCRSTCPPLLKRLCALILRKISIGTVAKALLLGGRVAIMSAIFSKIVAC